MQNQAEEVKQDEGYEGEHYTAEMSAFLTRVPFQVVFNTTSFKKVQTEKFNVDYNLGDILSWGVYDYNRFAGNALTVKNKSFVEQTSYQQLLLRIKALKVGKFLLSHQFPDLFQISNEYLQDFSRYMNHFQQNKKKNKKAVVFQHIKPIHLNFLEQLMKKQQTRSLPLTKKLGLIKQSFPQLNISLSTLYKMQRQKLGFNYKRITQYKPPGMDAKCKKDRRIAFLSTFLDFLEDEACEFFVLDEVGFGTKPLIRYGYSQVATPCVWELRKKLGHNMTCTATISTRGVEFLQFFTDGGTKNEMFEAYLSGLIEKMKVKYPNKELVFLLDNLWAHKSSLIMKILNNEDHCSLLLTPSNTPEFSPIENMFSKTKKILSTLETKGSPELFALDVTRIMFGFQEQEIQKFYRRTFDNFLSFWFNVKRNS